MDMGIVRVPVLHGTPFEFRPQFLFHPVDIFPRKRDKIELVPVFWRENDPEHVPIARRLPVIKPMGEIDRVGFGVEGRLDRGFPHEIEPMAGPGMFWVVFLERTLDGDASKVRVRRTEQSGSPAPDPETDTGKSPFPPDPGRKAMFLRVVRKRPFKGTAWRKRPFFHRRTFFYGTFVLRIPIFAWSQAESVPESVTGTESVPPL